MLGGPGGAGGPQAGASFVPRSVGWGGRSGGTPPPAGHRGPGNFVGNFAPGSRAISRLASRAVRPSPVALPASPGPAGSLVTKLVSTLQLPHPRPFPGDPGAGLER